MTRFASLEELPEAMRGQVRAQVLIEAKPRKYRNEPVTVGTRTFDSKFEAQRYQELLNLAAAELITDLYVQVPFGLDAWTATGPARIGAYLADFTYRRDGALIVEDVKSASTRKDKTYVWKRRHFEAQYGYTIVEVERQRRRK